VPLQSAQPSRTLIVTPAGKKLRWDDEDRLWLLRAVEAEGPPRDLVAQTLVNRWAWLSDTTPGRFFYLRELVRAYAQPVNPAWFPDGKLFLAELERAPDLQKPKMRAQAQHRAEVHAQRTVFSDATIKAVNRALVGPLSLPYGALHFAAPSLVRNDLPVLVPSEGGSNVIYGESKGRGPRARYSLQLASELGASSGQRAAAVVAALFFLGVGAALWGRRA